MIHQLKSSGGPRYSTTSLRLLVRTLPEASVAVKLICRGPVRAFAFALNLKVAVVPEVLT